MIHDDHVGVMSADGGQAGFNGVRGCDDVDIGLVRQRANEALEKQRMIVDHDNRDGHVV